MASKSKSRRRSKGVLAVISVLLLSSAFLRGGLEAAQAVARDSSSGFDRDATASAAMEPAVQCETDPDLLPLLRAMDRREERIREQEERAAIRMQTLKMADARIEKKMTQLREANDALRKTLAIADEAAEKDLMRLTAVYENMKPKDAAGLFEEMAPEFAAGFLGRMQPAAAAGVMAGLSPEAAYTISVILAGRNAKAPKE